MADEEAPVFSRKRGLLLSNQIDTCYKLHANLLWKMKVNLPDPIGRLLRRKSALAARGLGVRS